MRIELTDLELSVCKKIASETFKPYRASMEELMACNTLSDKIAELEHELDAYEDSCDNPCAWFLKQYKIQQSESTE